MSKKALKSAVYSINQFSAQHKKSMAFATRTSMVERLKISIKDLHALGYKVLHIKNLKSTHINHLVQHWKQLGLSSGSIKNRMADLRYVAKHFNREHIIHASNDYYGIKNRSYIPTKNKAMTACDFSKIKDERLRCSLELQQAFGLRREECLKIKPQQALRQNTSGQYYLDLQKSWTKGGIHRRIMITNDHQLNIIKKAQKIAGTSSMIPKEKTYKAQRNFYDTVTRQQGLYNLHGLRHAYAQKRYYEITQEKTNNNGWHCPIAGGLKSSQLTHEQKIIDQVARKIISNELGHSRIGIVKNYTG